MPELISICFHLLLLLSQTLNEFTDSVATRLLSVATGGAVPSPAVARSQHRRARSRAAPERPGRAPPPRPAQQAAEPGERQGCAPGAPQSEPSGSAGSALLQVLEESEDDLTRDDETGPEHCAAQRRDQIALPSKAALETVRAAVPRRAEGEQPEAVHGQGAANTAHPQLSTSSRSLPGDPPVPKREQEALSFKGNPIKSEVKSLLWIHHTVVHQMLLTVKILPSALKLCLLWKTSSAFALIHSSSDGSKPHLLLWDNNLLGTVIKFQFANTF